MFKIKHYLQKQIVWKKDNGSCVDYASDVATLILETSLVINCVDIETDATSRAIAVFEYDNVHFIDMHGEVKVMNRCTVKVDLQNMELLSTKADKICLSSKQSYILLAWYLVSSHHAKIHSGKRVHVIDFIEVVARSLFSTLRYIHKILHYYLLTLLPFKQLPIGPSSHQEKPSL